MRLFKLRGLPLAAALFVLFALTAPVLAASGQDKDTILIVAFGTSVEKARVSYENVENQVKSAFPGHDVRWAWTAHSLLSSGPDGGRLSPQEAFAKLGTEGVKKVAVISLHVIPGQEYSNLVATAKAFEGLPKGIERIRLSRPLLWDTDSMQAVSKLLLQSLPKKRKAAEGVIFVGHGTHHPSGVYYPALQHYIGSADPNAFIGTVEGDLELDALVVRLKARSIKKVWLAPLMTVAGDHAMNDLFGDEPDSWKKKLSAAGFTVETINAGLGENPAMVSRWVDGLKATLGEADPE